MHRRKIYKKLHKKEDGCISENSRFFEQKKVYRHDNAHEEKCTKNTEMQIKKKG